MKLYSTILNIGITPDLSSEEVKYVKMTNLLNLCQIFIASIPAIIFSATLKAPINHPVSLLRFELLIVMSLTHLYLMHKKHYIVTKISTIITPFFLIFVLPIITRYMHEAMLLWMPYGIMAIGSFCLSMFSFGKELKYIRVILISFYLMALFYDNVFIALAPSDLKFVLIREYYTVYKLAIGVVGLLLYINVYSQKSNNYQIQLELDYKNSLLIQMNETLEEQVLERTKKINIQNEHIKELAFTNSHLLRAAVTRVIGLAKILKTGLNKEDTAYCLQNIEDSASEMDNITRTLSINLSEEEE